MQFDSELGEGKLIKRYKRFMADIELPNKETATIHCPNTGSMATCAPVGGRVLYSDSKNPKRKYPWTWELTETAGGFIGVNTSRTNALVEEALDSRKIPQLSDYDDISREVKFGESRFDFCLKKDGKNIWVEVKNATLLHEDRIIFPDAVTARGLKHLKHLQDAVLQGDRAVMLYVVNRPDGQVFSPAYHIDPEYCQELERAIQNGVEVLAWRTRANSTMIEIIEPVEITLEKDDVKSR